jgi:hypothetical protein
MGNELRFEIPEGARLVNCRSCKAPIYFIPRPKQPEKSMPVNPDGVSHFATCPEAASFRKGKKI